MDLETVVKKLCQLKKTYNSLMTELTLFDDSSGEIFVDLDNENKENIEEQFADILDFEEKIELLIKKGGEKSKNNATKSTKESEVNTNAGN